MQTNTLKVITAIVAVLILANCALMIWLWTYDSSPPKRTSIDEISSFISSELQFNKEQTSAFLKLFKEHHSNQRKNNEDFILLKQKVNESIFLGEEKKADSLIQTIGSISVRKEQELARFFREAFKLCNQEQKQQLQSVFTEVTRLPK